MLNASLYIHIDALIKQFDNLKKPANYGGFFLIIICIFLSF